MERIVDWISRNARSGDWRQVGADYLTTVVDAGGSAAEALHEVACLAAGGAKLTRILPGAVGSHFIEVTLRDAAEVAIGATYALAWREGYAAGLATREGAMPRSRPIGFTPRH